MPQRTMETHLTIMTTTAEKIESLSRRITELRASIDECDAELQSISFKSEEPTDPEPTQHCWANIRKAATGMEYYISAWLNPEDAKKGEVVYGGGPLIRKGIHMREVTPQDEQDRLDAARYRFYKSHCGWLYFLAESTGVIDFDKEIDKAMGEDRQWEHKHM